MSLTPLTARAGGEPTARRVWPAARVKALTRKRYCAGKLFGTKRMFILSANRALITLFSWTSLQGHACRVIIVGSSVAGSSRSPWKQRSGNLRDAGEWTRFASNEIGRSTIQSRQREFDHFDPVCAGSYVVPP